MQLKAQASSQATALTDLEKTSLRARLEKAKSVIATKEELIQSLQEESEELRRQVTRVHADRSYGCLKSLGSHLHLKNIADIKAGLKEEWLN